MTRGAAASEDYLKTIYQHTEWQPDPITPSALASRLGISPASVTGMIKKLAAAGLVDHQPYGPLALTPAGAERALAVIRRHRLVETWLVTDMGYDWHEVHHEAEVLEHSISDRLLDAIDERLGRPAADPHGDPIPRADGSGQRERWMRLADAPDGTASVVLRVSDRDPGLLELLAAAGIRPGTSVELHRLPRGDIRLTAGPSDVVLDAARATEVWLTA